MWEFLEAKWVTLAAVLGVNGVIWTAIWWINRYDRRRREVREQLFEMEQAIREEGLPDDVREGLVRQREHQAEIRREARRRLGLPEEEPRRRG